MRSPPPRGEGGSIRHFYLDSCTHARYSVSAEKCYLPPKRFLPEGQDPPVKASQFNWPEKNSRNFATPQLFSPWNDVWAMTAEIPYWWRVTIQIWEVHFLTTSVNFDKCPCSYSKTNRRKPLHSLTINSLNSFQYTVYKEELWRSGFFFCCFWYFQMLQSSWRLLWSNKQRRNLRLVRS